MENLQNKIRKYWIDTPELFSERYGFSVFNLLSPTKAFLHSRRKKVLSLVGNLKGKQILDVGCGSGIFMIDFIEMGAKVIGVDYSNKMLDLAKKELLKSKIPASRFQLKKANAVSLPFKDKKFDVILASGLTDYLTMSENKKFIKEASRVLKKNGTLIVSYPIKESPVAFLRSGIGLWLRKKFLGLPPLTTSLSIFDIKSLLDEAGLKDTQHRKVFYTMWIIKAKRKN